MASHLGSAGHQRLQPFDCDFGQGYLFGRPTLGDELEPHFESDLMTKATAGENTPASTVLG